MIKRISTFLLCLVTVICVSCSTPQITQSVPLPSASATLPSNADAPIPSSISAVGDISTITPTLNPALAKVLTATPNFQSIGTRTPISPQQCPEVNANITLEIPKVPYEAPLGYSYPEAILDYLNAGGSPKILKSHLELDTRFWAEKDLTGDGVPEILVSIIGLNIFVCNNGQYINSLFVPLAYAPMAPTILAIQDMNLDGIPELVLEDEIFSAGVRMYKIYEWDGKEFQSLIWPETELYIWFTSRKGQAMNWYGYWEPNYLSPFSEIAGIASTASIEDIDGNGTQELIIHNQVPPERHRGISPWRATTDIYKWNGVIFMWDQVEIESPIYRFEAVQDGDRMLLLGEYQKALELYQAVVSSNRLYAWSLENFEQQLYALNQFTPTPTPIPVIQDEYDNLVAYAYYRIMLLQTIQADSVSAQATYETLQAKFPDGTQGQRFAKMAAEFWKEYQSSKNLGEACLKVIQYAEEHKHDIFTHLGNTEQDTSHGTQSHYYTPWDMCLFK